MPAIAPGRIVFLNGTSSSGKSSIATELLTMLDPPHFHLSADAFNAMRSREKSLRLAPAELEVVLRRTRAGFHRAVAAMAAAGNNVVADYVLSEEWRLVDCLRVLAGYQVVFVGVRCADAELARRELARGDREAGQGAAQQRRVHAHGRYDVECDTTAASPRQCAELIAGYLASGAVPVAFEQLRSLLQAPDHSQGGC